MALKFEWVSISNPFRGVGGRHSSECKASCRHSSECEKRVDKKQGGRGSATVGRHSKECQKQGRQQEPPPVGDYTNETRPTARTETREETRPTARTGARATARTETRAATVSGDG